MCFRPIVVSLLTSLSVTCFSFSQSEAIIHSEAVTQSVAMLELCKELHASPELSFQEFETSRKMATILENLGFEVSREFGGNNVVGFLQNGEGPTLMIRTDMDALPVEEKTGFEFASDQKRKNAKGESVSVMHACGHDIHMSVWAGTLRSLVNLKLSWSGNLLVIAQQAEEVGGGSGLAIENGLFEKYPVPNAALAFHINPELESGKIGLNAGPVFAGVKTVKIRVRGIGGHGAYPQECIDPVVIASRIVLDLQTIVSREISALEPAVVTVGSIHGGTRPNIIPDQVDLELTLRYYSDQTIDTILSSIDRISRAAAQASGVPDDLLPVITIDPTEVPPVLNDSELSEDIRDVLIGQLGAEAIASISPTMAGEDFGKYGRTLESVPICLMWLGVTSPELMAELAAKGEKPAPLHSPKLQPDYSKSIVTGIETMTATVVGLMNDR